MFLLESSFPLLKTLDMTDLHLIATPTSTTYNKLIYKFIYILINNFLI